MKGQKGGNCERSACQKPGAEWWNASTQAYYCGACARDINLWSLIDNGFRICFFGVGEPTFCEAKTMGVKAP